MQPTDESPHALTHAADHAAARDVTNLARQRFEHFLDLHCQLSRRRQNDSKTSSDMSRFLHCLQYRQRESAGFAALRVRISTKFADSPTARLSQRDHVSLCKCFR
jgi:hypothetical protein